MITKNEFVEIIERLKATEDTVNQINDILNNCRDRVESEFTRGYSLMVCHDDIVVKLLDNMFDTDMISWWIYETEYGARYTEGCVQEADGTNIDVSNASKLYDYLIENK